MLSEKADLTQTSMSMPQQQAPADLTPLPDLELMPPPGTPQLHFFEHPEELQITGITQMCPKCRARQNWLIILYLGNVWIRCRCAHEWREPELTPADFEEMAGPRIKAFEDMDTASRALGYDGSLSGIYLQ